MVKCYKKDYPRPQFVRDEWVDLNGKWDFSFDDSDIGEVSGWYKKLPAQKKILVPFTYETKMSGIGDESVHNQIWYQRTFDVSPACLGQDRLYLHLEGADYRTKVWVNGIYVGLHEGGYSRFTFDITNTLTEGENNLVIKVEDSLDERQPRGKQRWKESSFACWYVQSTGIWKTVWLEQVPCQHIESVKITPDVINRQVDLEFELSEAKSPVANLEVEVSYNGCLVNRVIQPVLNNECKVKVDLYNLAVNENGVELWRPDHPALYDLSFVLTENGVTIDRVGSYFGLRDIQIKGQDVLLNGEPLYQRLILDQGYWKDTHLTPPSEAALVKDIDSVLQLGYNGVRKHQKTEDERFLYWCDVKGLLVWSEMAAAYRFSDYAVQCFTNQWMEIVRQNYNHPSIITWTPFNESWGIPAVEKDRAQQHFTEAIYHLTKCFDPYRPVIVNDGWEHTVSDIITLHDYEELGGRMYARYTERKEDMLNGKATYNNFRYVFAEGFAYQGQPIIISEFGGIAFSGDEHGWGYGSMVKGEDEFLARFESVTTAVKKLPYVCGFCYTQLTDVQQEINGLLDEERHFKVTPGKVKEINTRHTD